MGIRKYKPTTPGRRGASGSDFSEITRSEPEKSLVRPLHSKGGRNVHGRVTARHQGGGHKRAYRLIDFRRHDKDGVRRRSRTSSTTRTARRASRCCTTRTARSATSSRPQGLQQGDRVENGPGCGHQAGQRAAAAVDPDRHRRSTRSRCGPVAARRSRGRPARASSCWPRRAGTRRCACPPVKSAGSSFECRATVGEVGNSEQGNIKLGKAGRNRWKGKRPSVRGVAMNPVDHPLGGGEGKSSGGRHPVSPWGKPEGRTRREHKPSDRLIGRRRAAARTSGRSKRRCLVALRRGPSSTTT